MTEEEKTQRERAFSHWLCNIEGIGRKTAGRLLDRAGSAGAVYAMTGRELKELLTPSQLTRFLQAREGRDPAAEYRRLAEKGIRCLPRHDPRFPGKLRLIPDGPTAVYVRGELPDPSAPAVAVVGARSCSGYGRAAAEQFTEALVGAGAVIISGLARGIDGISQERALSCGGKTYAVLGCGVDVCYPEENRGIYERIRRQGGLISEYPPGTLPRAGLFPQRNRLISGLADLILVVEARERSGTLITVDMALEQGREVYAVPGRVTDRLSLGCNRLLRQGAGVAAEPADLLNEIRRMGGKGADGEDFVSQPFSDCLQRNGIQRDGIQGVRAAGDEQTLTEAVWNCLDYTPMTPDQLLDRLACRGIQIGPQKLLQTLMELLLEENCSCEGGSFYLKSGK